MRRLIVALLLTLLLPSQAFAVIAHETATESHTGTTGSTSQASFDISVPFTSSSKGLLVFTYNANSNANDGTSVKIDPTGANTDVPAVTGGLAADTVGEAGSCKAWFKGSGLPTTTTTVRVNRNNNANIMYAVAITVSGSANIFAGTPSLQQEDAAMTEISIDSGTNLAVRYGCGYGGSNAPPAAGASSTLLHDIDLGSFGAAAVRETTAGTGARSTGLTNASDDRAEVVLALAEVPACTGTTWTSGVVKGINAVFSADTATLTLQGTPSGSFVGVGTSVTSGTVSTIAVSDSVNGSYTESFFTVTSSAYGTGVHYLANNAGGNIVITANPTGATHDITLAAHTFCGGHATPASGTPGTNSGTGTTASTGTMTPADNSVLVLASTILNQSATVITENASSEAFTLSNERESPTHLSFTYKIISGAPGTPSESWTLSQSADWRAGIAAFKPAGGGATPSGMGVRRIQ